MGGRCQCGALAEEQRLEEGQSRVGQVELLRPKRRPRQCIGGPDCGWVDLLKPCICIVRHAGATSVLGTPLMRATETKKNALS